MNISSLTKSVHDGSLASLDRLVGAIGSDNSRCRVFIQSLPAIQHRLNVLSHEIPDTWIDPDEHPMNSAALCLQGFTVGVSETFKHHDIRSVPDTVERIRQTWPDVFRWITYILEFYLLKKIDNIPEHESPEDELTYNVVLLIKMLSEVQPFVPMMGLTNGFVALLARLWIVVSAYDLTVMGNCTTILRNLGHNVFSTGTRTNSTPWIEEFQILITSPTIDLATPCVTRLIRELNSSRPTYHTLKRTLVTMGAFGDPHVSSRRPFLLANSIRWVTELIHRLTSKELVKTMSIDEFKIAKGCLSVACAYLLNNFDDNFNWVAQSLEHHLLRSIMQSELYFKLPPGPNWVDPSTQRTLESLFVDVIDRVHTHVVLWPVLKLATREVSRINGMTSSPENAMKRVAPAVHAAWMRLKHTVDIWGQLQRKSTWRGKAECENNKCRRVRNTDLSKSPRLKVCQQCKSAFYCCKDCQAVEWKSGHRERCQMLNQSRLAGHQRPINSREMFFLLHLTEHDIASNSNEIHNLKLQNSSKTPVITVDYTQIPRKLGIASAKDYATTRPDWQVLVAQAEQNGNYLVHITAPQGPFPYQHFYNPNDA